jgi:hypothetical protein
MGFETPIQATQWTETHALDRPDAGIGFSIICSFYLAIRSTYYFLEQHNKAQNIEDKIEIFIITKDCTKNNFMLHTLCCVIVNVMCVYLRQIASTNNLIPRYMSIFKYRPPFLCFAFIIHLAIPDFSLMNFVWNYTEKTKMLKSLHFVSVKLFI